MRLLRDEHRRTQHAGLSDTDQEPEGGGESDHAAAAFAGPEGSHSRPDRIVRAVRADRAMAAVGSAATGPRAPAIARGSRQAGWPVGVHPLFLLFHIMPELLVEPGQVSRSVHPSAVLSLARRQS